MAGGRLLFVGFDAIQAIKQIYPSLFVPLFACSVKYLPTRKVAITAQLPTESKSNILHVDWSFQHVFCVLLVNHNGNNYKIDSFIYTPIHQ